MKNKKLKIIFALVCVLLTIPSIIYIISNKTVLGFNIYYNFFITEKINKIVSTMIYIIIFIMISILYLKIIKEKDIFKDVNECFKYVLIISIIFAFMLPWTSSDIFYYMGVGELDAVYKQNPYYITMKKYYEQNPQSIENDSIFEQGVNNFWAGTTVVYGPIAQTIFKICALISFRNIDICILIFKLINVIVHIANCYLIYKITRRKKFSIIYGLNPFILLEFIGMVHNDIIVVFFVLLSLYYLLKKKNIYLSILFLALATGIKYFTVLLLPIIILYHFRKEDKIGIRFLKCIEYGIMFFIIVAIFYIPYFKNINIILAMSPQGERYSKSIYVGLSLLSPSFMLGVRCIMIMLFSVVYIISCLELLFNKQNKITNMLRKYNIALILFLLILSNSQQWYLIWLFATIMWQKPKMIKNIIGITLAIEIANSIYMFKSEWYMYDVIFIGTTVWIVLLWDIFINKKYLKDRSTQIGKISIN